MNNLILKSVDFQIVIFLQLVLLNTIFHFEFPSRTNISYLCFASFVLVYYPLLCTYYLHLLVCLCICVCFVFCVFVFFVFFVFCFCLFVFWSFLLVSLFHSFYVTRSSFGWRVLFALE